ncbi:IS1249 family transposase [Bifidobacterium sp. ESL0775]|uniref:IS1249 family transposase n=1 Tax=Bifidobacterium sp. ESL0775 TaxID=2983230 RepID=UPI0023F772D1|nr:IS1249 family transposase [Bifidobacterium sp. ESL0775]WEV68587.1 IS1249 family transposase [Bifidobacterium sp. ESL0775]WEV69588.1 IS1249 family transposase [Bifidobacterium sp. ESL0775]
MREPLCAACGGKMKRNGTTSAGRARWRCVGCGASRTQGHDRGAIDLKAGLDWLFSKRSQAESAVPDRTQRRRNLTMWSLNPPTPLPAQRYDVVHADGIWLHRRAVVLIAIAGGHVAGWHVARSENGRAWAALMRQIRAPKVLVCDGGNGIGKAMRAVWPGTKMQRCLFHICMNITTLTGKRPKLQAGKELLKLAQRLSRVKSEAMMRDWLVGYNQWEQDYKDFLDEKSRYADGSLNDAHQRLARARTMIRRRISEHVMDTFITMQEECAEPVPPDNNLCESWNRQLRDMLREHNGLPLIREIKAICWWCHMHTEHPESPAWLARHCLTDQQVEQLSQQAWQRSPEGRLATTGEPTWGTGIDWDEFHTPTRYPNQAD